MICKYNSDIFIKGLLLSGCLPKGRLDVPTEALEILHLAAIYVRITPDSNRRMFFNDLIRQFGMPVPVYNNVTSLPVNSIINQTNGNIIFKLSEADSDAIKTLFDSNVVFHAFSEVNEYFRGISQQPQRPGQIEVPVHAPVTSFFTTGELNNFSSTSVDCPDFRTVPFYKIDKYSRRNYGISKIIKSYSAGNTSQDGEYFISSVPEPNQRFSNVYFAQTQDEFKISETKSSIMAFGVILTLKQGSQLPDFSNLLCIRTYGTVSEVDVEYSIASYAANNLRPVKIEAITQTVQNTSRSISRAESTNVSEPVHPTDFSKGTSTSDGQRETRPIGSDFQTNLQTGGTKLSVLKRPTAPLKRKE